MVGNYQGGLDQADIRFIRSCMKAPLLSRDREQALALAWRDRHDQGALHELILAYSRLVVAAAVRLRGYGLPLGDLIQEGNIGLMEAATRFDPDRAIRFSTYAGWWIRAAMQDYILRNWSIVRTGTTAAQKSLFFNLRRLRARIEGLSAAPLSEASCHKIAAALNVDAASVAQMDQRLAAADQSLNAPYGEGNDDWQEFLADGRPSPEEMVIGRHDSLTRARWLAEALAALTPRERRIITERRLTDGGTTLEDLGRALGVSKERVRQLEQRALAKLRQSLARRASRADLFFG